MLLLRGATTLVSPCALRMRVSIHAPLARSNCGLLYGRFPNTSFNTCSSCEEQQATGGIRQPITLFQYMLLLRGATSRSVSCFSNAAFQYMLLLRGATTGFRTICMRRRGFNTCSSCEEQPGRRPRLRGNPVSIHAPLARSNHLKQQQK